MPIQLVPDTGQSALEAADKTVDQLLDSGRPPGDILVLTTSEPHPWQQHELSFGETSYWNQLDEGGDVFYAQAAALARVVQRPVVVLAVNGGSNKHVAQALSGALSRARALLIVCGDPLRLRTLLDSLDSSPTSVTGGT